jgi:YD repeat-containing protein
MNSPSVRGKGSRLLLLPISLFLALHGPAAFATADDCVEDDPAGRVICKGQLPEPININPCDEAASSSPRAAAWCTAAGGVFHGVNASPSCTGNTPFTEENVAARAAAFGQILHNVACGVTGDTGWNTSYDTNFCVPSTGAVFDSGYLIRDGRRLTLACGELISVAKGRSLDCPVGFAGRNVLRNGRFVTACTRPVDCPYCNDVGNPVSAGSGTKTQAETDYRSASGLVFTRYYDSNRFGDPVTLVPDSHTVHQLGTTWRSNFDKRVIPLGVPSGVITLTFPDGQIQYFDSLGKEIINYAGARASLVALPGGGYVYQGPEVIESYRADGRLLSITQRSGESLTLAYSDGTSGVFVDAAGNPTTAPLSANLLTRVTDSYGKALSFDYSASGKLVVMTDPAGGRTLYAYDVQAIPENLASVTYPDGHLRQYRYTEPANMPTNIPLDNYPHALTSIVDENGALFASFKYNVIAAAASTEHALGAQRYQFAYPSPTTTTITDPLGTARTFTFQVVDGLMRMTANPTPGGAGFGSDTQSQTYDTTGNLLSKTDFNNNKTCYAYDTVRNLETVRVEGVAAATSCTAVTASGAALPAGSRKITTGWHPRWRTPASTSEPRRRTTYLYNGDAGASCAPASAVIVDGSANGQPIGVLCTKTVQSTTDADGSQGFTAALQGQPRTWNYAYNAHGKVLTADGPRIDVSDITTTTYYADDDPDTGKRGNVASITNALGHLTSITAYNGHGQPLTIVDPSGLSTTLTYDERQRLKSRNVGGELTSYDYDGVGQLKKVTLPDASFLSYTYDDAHRLTGMSDNLGNSITYTLDAMGNRTKEDVRDPANALAQTRTRVFNNLNQLFQEIGAQNQTTQYAYDNQGNVTSVTDPLNHATSNQYDALNRLKQVTDPNSGVTQYGYNGIDQLVSVTDPRNLATTYNYDGLANLNSQASPDAGATNNTYDAAGNLLTQTDAKQQVTTYVYDVLNRVTSITFQDGTKQTYAYDQGTNGIGRLSSITETDPLNEVLTQINYGYDPHGRVTSVAEVVDNVSTQHTVGYQYDSFGRMAQITYPFSNGVDLGGTVNYVFDGLGRIGQVSVSYFDRAFTPPAAVTKTVVQNVQYQPFGGVKSFTLGNGQTYTRGYDQDGRIASYNLGAQTFALGYDAASRITFLNDTGNPVNSNTYGYDLLDRLTSAVLPNLPFAYHYDAVGNRSSKTVGSSTDTYAYGTTSNRLASITAQAGAVRNFSFDANGSTTNDGLNQYVYDARGRLVQGTNTAACLISKYRVNALGQRVRKTVTTCNTGAPVADTLYVYDLGGRLLSENLLGGNYKRAYIYLNDIPVGLVWNQNE